MDFQFTPTPLIAHWYGRWFSSIGATTLKTSIDFWRTNVWHCYPDWISKVDKT